jgi:steroid delta-isomerase-like uncharacterized protein
MGQSTTQLVERFYYEVWNRAEEAIAYEILHSDFRFRSSLGQEKSGPAGFIEYMRLIHAALAGYTCTIQEIVEQGERAAVRLSFAGVHQGPFFGVPATGREIAWSGAAFFETNESQIVALWVLGDLDAVKQQLGLQDDPHLVP